MWLKRTRLIVMATVMLCIFAQSAVATSAISIEPAHTDGRQNDEFIVNVTVDPAENEVYGASYALHFDNTLLNATTQAKGPFLTQDGASSNIYKDEIDNTIGEIIYAETRSATAGVTDPGVLTTITFQVIGDEGVCSLSVGDLDGELLYSLSGSIPTDVNNGTCEIDYMVRQTPTLTSDPPTTTATTTATTTTTVQKPTTTRIKPTPTATVIQTPMILSTPSSSPTIVISPTPMASMLPSEEKSEESNSLSGFTSVFAVTGLLVVLILKRKDARRRN